MGQCTLFFTTGQFHVLQMEKGKVYKTIDLLEYMLEKKRLHFCKCLLKFKIFLLFLLCI